ncbi:MAG: GTPase [Thermoguttaceae bacterium]
MPKPFSILRLTPEGRGGIGSLLLSGPGAEEAFLTFFTFPGGRLCTSADLTARRDRPIFGHFALGATTREEILVRAVSPTEIEIHSHGGEAIRSAFLRVLTGAGGELRVDEPPRWDVPATEGRPDFVADARRLLPYARTERMARLLLEQIDGAPRRFFRELESLGADERAGKLRRAQALAAIGRAFYSPPRVLLLGPVNAGKSSLLNALLGFDRALVDPTAGTTRDAVSVETVLGGLPILLSDTAGVRERAGTLERLGIERIVPLLKNADLLLMVFDITAPGENPPIEFADALRRTASTSLSPPAAGKTLWVLNKSDLPAASRNPFWKSFRVEGDEPILTDARSADSVALLGKRLIEKLFITLPQAGEFVPLTAGQLAYCRERCV